MKIFPDYNELIQNQMFAMSLFIIMRVSSS